MSVLRWPDTFCCCCWFVCLKMLCIPFLFLSKRFKWIHLNRLLQPKWQRNPKTTSLTCKPIISYFQLTDTVIAQSLGPAVLSPEVTGTKQNNEGGALLLTWPVIFSNHHIEASHVSICLQVRHNKWNIYNSWWMWRGWYFYIVHSYRSTSDYQGGKDLPGVLALARRSTCTKS